MKKISPKMQEALDWLKNAAIVVRLEGSKPVEVYPDDVKFITLKALKNRGLVESKFKSLSYDQYNLRIE
jgi:hypothetical protein